MATKPHAGLNINVDDLGACCSARQREGRGELYSYFGVLLGPSFEQFEFIKLCGEHALLLSFVCCPYTLLCAFLEQNKRPALWLPFNFLTSYARLITSFLLAVPYSTLVVWMLAACCENVGEMPLNCREGVFSETSIHAPATIRPRVYGCGRLFGELPRGCFEF